MKKYLLAGIAVAALAVMPAQALQAPDQVKAALAVLNRVVGHTGRLIAAQNYPHLPHENGEFKEGAEALLVAIKPESSDFRAKVQVDLDWATSKSAALSDAAGTHDDLKLRSLHKAFESSVVKVLADFPAEVQPAATPAPAP